MRHSPVCHDLISQRAFGPKRELVPGRLTIDQELTATRIARGHVCTGAITLFTHNKKQPEIPPARAKQRFSGCNHSRDDALRITRAATPDVVVVLVRGNKRRNRIHVR